METTNQKENYDPSMPLLVLAGGFGTRLQSVLSDQPKPLAPAAGKPFLEFLIQSWVKNGITQFIFMLHYQAEKIIAFLQTLEEGLLKSCSYTTVIERQPLGTGGAIANTVQELGLDGHFLATNADTWYSGDSLAVMQGAINSPAIAVIKLPNTSRYGSVRFDNKKRVTGFVEKHCANGPGWINAGLYRLHTALFSEWNRKAFSIEHKLFPNLAKNQQLLAVPLETEFIDIGIPEDYQRFKEWVETERNQEL